MPLFNRLLAPVRARLAHPYIKVTTTVGGACIAGLSLWTLIAHEIVNPGVSEACRTHIVGAHVK